MLSASDIAELKEYYKAYDFETYPSEMKNIVEYLLENPNIEIPPICVPSYKRRKSAVFLSTAVEKNFRDNVIVYCYEMEEDLYKDFPNRVLVPNRIRTESKYPLAAKLNFILEDQKKRGATEVFRIDDDIFNLCLPLPMLSKSGNAVNGKFKCSYNLAFHMWYAIHKYFGLDASALMHNTDFVFWDISKHVLMKHMQLCGAALVPTNFKYDEGQGWEDVDFQLQLLKSGLKTAGVPVMMQTPGYMRNLTTMNYANDRLDEMRRSVECLVKWGNKLISPKCKTFTNWTIKTNWRFIDKNGVNDETIKPMTLTKEQYDSIEYITKAMLDPKDRGIILCWFFDKLPSMEECAERIKNCQAIYEEKPTNNMIKYGDSERGSIIFSLSFGNRLPQKAIEMHREYRERCAKRRKLNKDD